MNTKNGEIGFYDSYHGNEYIPLAPDFKGFLDVLIIEVEYDKIGYLNLDFTDQMRDQYKEKLTAILMKKYYLKSYFDNFE